MYTIHYKSNCMYTMYGQVYIVHFARFTGFWI